MSPKKHLKNIYEVTIDVPYTNTIIKGFNKGVNIGNNNRIYAEIVNVNEYKADIIIKDGGYYQTRKMFECYNAHVIDIKRICIGNIYLPENLQLGQVREVTEEEINMIQEI